MSLFKSPSTSFWRYSLVSVLFIFLLLTLFVSTNIIPKNRISATWLTKHLHISLAEEPVLKHNKTDQSNESTTYPSPQSTSDTKKLQSSPSDKPQNTSSTVNENETETEKSGSNTKKNDDTDPLEPSQVSNSSCNMPQPPSYPVQSPEDGDLPQHILDYIEFHKKGRACLLDPACKQKPKILVATCPKSDKGPKACLGLGDRMRGIVFSFTLALVTKRLYFLDEFSHPYPLQFGLSPNAIDWTLPPTVQFNHSWPYLEWYWCQKGRTCSGSSPAETDFPNFEDTGPGINMEEDDIVKLFDDKPMVQLACRITFWGVGILEKNPHLKDTYADLSKFLGRRPSSIHRLLFQPSEPTKQMMKGVEFKGDYISVHLRTGVDAKEDKELDRFKYFAAHQEKSTDRMVECMGRMLEGTNITNVFLASDASTTKELFTKKATEKGYVVHVFNKKTVHYGKLWTFGSVTWDALCDGFITIFSDLFMLTRGKIMLKNGSNFAMFAGYLAKDQEVIQYRPGHDSMKEKCQPVR